MVVREGMQVSEGQELAQRILTGVHTGCLRLQDGLSGSPGAAGR